MQEYGSSASFGLSLKTGQRFKKRSARRGKAFIRDEWLLNDNELIFPSAVPHGSNLFSRREKTQNAAFIRLNSSFTLHLHCWKPQAPKKHQIMIALLRARAESNTKNREVSVGWKTFIWSRQNGALQEIMRKLFPILAFFKMLSEKSSLKY